MHVRSDRRYRFPVPPDQVWSAATAIDSYTTWWPWLRRFDADAFRAGAVWSCVVKPPLPYAVAFTVTLDEVVPVGFVRASIAGDVTGSAEIVIAEAPGGSEARLVSELAPGSSLLEMLARAARPVVRLGHDWVLDTGARQFRAGALPEIDVDPVT